MKVGDLYKNNAGKPVVSFEFFRAKTPKAADSLEKVMDLLAGTRHDYMSVTFGAGGSAREGSYQLIDKLKNERSLKTVAYIAGVGLGPAAHRWTRRILSRGAMAAVSGASVDTGNVAARFGGKSA